MDDAKDRFRMAINIPDFNKQFSIVSIVGGLGVGKSTVASLLSGNNSMFVTDSTTTTTTGADISTIIPTTEYADVLNEQLGMVVNKVSDKLQQLLIYLLFMKNNCHLTDQ